MTISSRPTPRWRAIVLVLAGLGLSALLAAGAFLAWQRVALSPDGNKPAYVPLATDKSLGVNASLAGLSPEERAGALDAIEAAGLRWLRLRVPWDAVEPQRGAYAWDVWDEIIEEVTRHNIALIAVLDGSPAWARAGEDAQNPLAPPIEIRDFGEFVATFATHYGDRIDHYQIWDEPNIAPHWGVRETDPVSYARLLREGAIQVRAADPGAVVLLAALAPNVELGGANMSDVLYLEALYRAGAAEWFDIVAAQPYTFDAPLEALPDPDQLNWNRPALLRAVMEAHGDVNSAVWAVSSGLTSVTEDVVRDAVLQTRRDWPWLGPLLWAAWSPQDARGQYALVDQAGLPGASHRALQSLAGAPAVAWPGVYPADDPNAAYEGDWRVAPSGADIGASGDLLSIPFHGTRLDLTVRRGDYRAFLFVTVDGRPSNALPRDTDGRSYVVLYDPLGETGTVTLVRELAEGDHVAEIVAERGWGQWAIVGWSVLREPGALPGWLPVVLGLLAIAVLAVTVRYAWSARHDLLDAVQALLGRYRALDDRLVLVITVIAALMVYAMAGTIPTLVALALLALLLLLRPEMGLPLIALALPFYQLGRPLLGKVFSMVEILTVLTAAGCLVHWAAGKLIQRRAGGEGAHHPQPWLATIQLPARPSGLDWAVLALVATAALSLLWADQGREAAREFRTVVLESVIFYTLLRLMVTERRDLWRVADVWVLGGATIALVGLAQWILGDNLITAEGVWRVRGFYGSPNNLALYLGRVLPLAVALGAFLPHPLRLKLLSSEGTRRRWGYGLAALLMLGVILLTYSRGAWLVGVPASLLFLAAMRGRRAFVLTAGLLIVAAVVAVLIVGPGRLVSLLDPSEGTTFFRLQLWQSSWSMVKDQPLTGVGLDNFLYAYRSHYVLPTAWEEFNLSHPHNLVFDFWLRLGLLGLLALIWLLVAFFRQGFQAYRRLPEGAGRLLALGLMGGMVNFVAHGLVDNAYFLVDLAYAFALMLALIQVRHERKQAYPIPDAPVVSNL